MTEPNLRDCTDPAVWWPHLDEAVRTLARGALAVIPTDTVYGIAADAFTPDAVAALLKAKGRGRQMPPPVLIGDVRTLDGLALDVPPEVRDLVEAFWPGPLTIIVNAQPSLMWDLGETQGTVALRMPDNEFTLALLRRTGPLAVSSANKSGRRAARTANDAARQLRKAVSIYLDNGRSRGAVPSTIIDATGPELKIVRQGALRPAELAKVVPSLAPQPEPEAEAGGETAEAQGLADAPEAQEPAPAPENAEVDTAEESAVDERPAVEDSRVTEEPAVEDSQVAEDPAAEEFPAEEPPTGESTAP